MTGGSFARRLFGARAEKSASPAIRVAVSRPTRVPVLCAMTRDTTPLLRRRRALGLTLSLASLRIGVDPKRADQRPRPSVYSFGPLAPRAQPGQHRRSPFALAVQCCIVREHVQLLRPVQDGRRSCSSRFGRRKLGLTLPIRRHALWWPPGRARIVFTQLNHITERITNFAITNYAASGAIFSMFYN
jgi:hypothetical protein